MPSIGDTKRNDVSDAVLEATKNKQWYAHKDAQRSLFEALNGYKQDCAAEKGLNKEGDGEVPSCNFLNRGGFDGFVAKAHE